ncbi:hypothetical protein ABW16_06525 [Mycolicibacter heraklionensis]|uniref:DUF559 domain-containing protein n=1 Tax=Mycolicibacter heraklionensis TaxID=512402 RepID=A0ABR5FIK3_9MYCO|nr:hypothetical protein [Mycolicibacter heraklionensis]KLO30554.1 hypothetical protein ABW16_06525 [Mycolicibacter heraklionensis]
MTDELDMLLAEQGGVATAGQFQRYLGRAAFETSVARGDLAQVWFGVYSRSDPDTTLRLAGLDLRAGEQVAVCLGTAAAAYGFDTEGDPDLHVLNPVGRQLRKSDGLVVHRRQGAPLAIVDGRLATEAGWTAVEVARSLRRPRALATLDAALRSGTCDRRQLRCAAARQSGRRGIVIVRELIPLADGRSDSAMESEARLGMLDGGLPPPELQYEIVDHNFQTWRVDFAWPRFRVAVEYDSYDFHSSPEALRRERRKRAALQDVGWAVLSIVDDDVRRRSWDMVRRIERELSRSRAA